MFIFKKIVFYFTEIALPIFATLCHHWATPHLKLDT